jgi:hypothetical protein
MKENVVDKILSITGYLPPRNEEEMEAFEKVYSKAIIDKNRHVDVDSIVNDACRYIPVESKKEYNIFPSGELRMVARNFEHMPKEIIDKIKKQHKKNGDKGK